MLGVVVTLFFFGKMFYDIRSDHILAVYAAEQHAKGLASALNEHLLRTFNDAEATIDSVIRDIDSLSSSGVPSESALQPLLAGRNRPGSTIASLFVASPDGQLHAISTQYPVIRRNVADREYFRQHQSSSDGSLFIGKPFRDRRDGEWLITATKRLSNPDGTPRMTVGVSVKTRHFSAFYGTLELGRNDMILLIRRDGTILSQWPFSEKTARASLPDPGAYQRELRNAPGSGTYQAEHAPGDTMRIVSYRSCAPYPVMAVVSLDKGMQLSQWRRRAIKEVAGAGLFIALAAALALLIRSQMASLGQANMRLSNKQSELREAKRRSQEIVNSIDGIVWEIDLASRKFTFVSERSEAITGFPSAAWLADPKFWSDHLHPDDESSADWFVPEAGAAPNDGSFEYRFRIKDGSFIWVRDIVTVVTEEAKPTRLRGVMLDISQAKKSEATLLEYRKAIECSSDMVSVVDRDYRCLVANRALLDHLRVERADLLGQPLERVLGAARFAKLKPHLDACLSGRAVSFELQEQSPEGCIREFSVSYSPVEESGVVSRVACVARDTSEEKRAGQALRESELRYRRISNAVTDYIYTVRVGEDLELKTWHGAGCLALTGYTKEEFSADRYLWLRMVAQEDRNAVLRHASRLLSGEEAGAIEHRIIRKDGRLRWIRNTPVPGLDEAGRIREYEGLIQDITEKRITEEALRLSEKRFREVLENIHLVSVILDTTGKVTFCNDFLLQLTGWSREETVGANWFDLFIPKQLQSQVREIFEEGLARGELPAHYENQIVTREGAYRSIIWDNTMLHHSDGSLAGTARIGMDITRHRELEEQLRQSQKMEATGLLAGGIAHDFNNILTVIIGYCSIMQMRMGPDDPNSTNVDQVLAAAERAAGLTRSLLAFSRKQVMNPQQVDLNAIVRHVEHFLCRVIGEDITLKADLHDEELFILADSGQVEQILMNLATNARDAMPGGGILRVSTHAVDLDGAGIGNDNPAPGRYAQLTVSDNGAGMDEELRAKIFEPFFTTKEVGKGTGLGLAMVYGIIMQHNGQIMVESERGKGTSFKVYLPLVSYQAPEQGLEAPRLKADAGHELILVAEDEPAVRDLVEKVLTNFGYRVLLACDGEEAVARFGERRDEIDLVLMDMIMPRMSGKAAFDEISRQSPGTRVLFTSGYTADFISSKGEIGPGVELLMKPVQPLVLLRKVREMLDG